MNVGEAPWNFTEFHRSQSVPRDARRYSASRCQRAQQFPDGEIMLSPRALQEPETVFPMVRSLLPGNEHLRRRRSSKKKIKRKMTNHRGMA